MVNQMSAVSNMNLPIRSNVPNQVSQTTHLSLGVPALPKKFQIQCGQ